MEATTDPRAHPTDAPTGTTLTALVRHVPGLHLHGRGDVAALDVTLDSRHVPPGSIFAALPGAAAHGAEHAAHAVAGGAVAVLTDRAGAEVVRGACPDVPVLLAKDPRAAAARVAAVVHGRPGDGLTLVGVTGTNGKTTTTFVLDAALRAAGRPTGLLGTVEHRIGDLVRPARLTTPDAPDLQRSLAAMRAAGVDVVTMECSSHALTQHRLDTLTFDVVAFTNLSREHLDHHGTMEAYYAAKASLFDPTRARRGVVVVDDAWGRRLAGEARIPVTTLATDDPRPGGADWRVVGENGSDDFDLVGDGVRMVLRSPLPGEHNRANTAVAALVLHLLGEEPRRIETLLAGPVTVPGRMQRLDLGPDAPRAFVDFMHTPDGMAKVVAALRRRTTGRLVVTVSAGGGRDPGKRAPIGRAAVLAGADVLVVTDDHPRHEDPATIRAAVLTGVREAVAEVVAAGRTPPVVVEVADGRRAAMEVALDLAGPEGTVGFLGLGPDRHQHIGPPGTLVPFVETEEIVAAWGRVHARAATR